MNIEKITLNEERNVTLTAFIQEVGGDYPHITRRPSVLILPGGAYQSCADKEAEPVAFPYLEAGYQAFILRYSLKENAAWPNPLKDYEAAITLIRKNAEKWHLFEDKIAVIGFSAGGHLASAAATMSENRPNAAILGYAGTLDDMKALNSTHPNTAEAVDYKTCPCFLFATCNDNIVPVRNTILFTERLARYGVSFESHIYAYGPHGFSVCTSGVQDDGTPICSRVSNWVQDSICWLKDVFGDFSVNGMTEPVIKGLINGNNAPYLSADCTMAVLNSSQEAQKLVGELMAKLMSGAQLMEAPESMGDVSALVANMTLRDCLGFSQVPQEIVDGIDAELRKLPNPLTEI